MLACIYHWYISTLYAAPVVALGVWGWRANRRAGASTPEEQAPDEVMADDLASTHSPHSFV
ncbi:MAG TPA: hypothetical protein VHX88_15695 [Solirubrobacteraceae bacterium]|jgi:hypothetical protein|nr:hypothetical protein [Solirubrobacteraceae bacterium]